MTLDAKPTNDKEMNNAYDIASKLLLSRMSTEKRNALGALKATDILIVPDIYDRVEQVLDVMGIPLVFSLLLKRRGHNLTKNFIYIVSRTLEGNPSGTNERTPAAYSDGTSACKQLAL